MSRTFKTAFTGRRLHHVTQRYNYSTTSLGALTQDLRALFRNTAQPVAVVTSLMPKTEPSPGTTQYQYHGATLSSFTSIAMDPHPLVAFSLRIPSRMATSLKAAQPELPSHMVINLLSAEQRTVAVAFSRPDLHPHPFTGAPYTLTKDGLPVIQGSLGAISCKLVSSALPLHDLDYLEQRMQGKDMPEPVLGKDCVASELFIARVVRVEKVDMEESRAPPKRPLVYYHRDYTTVSPTARRTSINLNNI